MKVRSITFGVKQQDIEKSFLEDEIKGFFLEANLIFCDNEIEVRTQRIGLSPFSIKSEEDGAIAISSVNSISRLCENVGARWFDVPFQTVNSDLDLTNAVALEVIKLKNTFVNFLATKNNRIDIDAVYNAAQFVKNVAELSSNGIDNFRFGTSFNTRPNGAFFPFMHHEGENGFSIALELILPIVDAIKTSQATTLEAIREDIKKELIQLLIKVDDVCKKLEGATGKKYYGIDASLAPHPESEDCSIGYLFSLLGVKSFGNSGTLFIASYFTDIIKSVVECSGIRATGFNGVMYSVLEDHSLGKANMEPGNIPMSQLMALSAICGCGVDMVPVPGDISRNEIASIMLDIGAKATWLNKPLGVRLLPIPGKGIGDLTDFEHDFFVNTRIQNDNLHQGFDKVFEGNNSFVYSRD